MDSNLIDQLSATIDRLAVNDTNQNRKIGAWAMAAKIKEKHVVDREDQLEALVSPIRYELYTQLARLEGATIRHVADEMGRSAASLYRHMSLLVECELVRVDGKINEGPSKADLYVPIAKQLSFPSNEFHPVLMDSLGDLYKVLLRKGEEEFIQGLKSPDSRTTGKAKNLYAMNGVAWLTKSELSEINVLFREVHAILRGGEQGRKGVEPIGITIAVRPADAD